MKHLDIRHRIEELLKYLRINQKEFSKKTGISENTISHAKKGKHTPNIEFFNSIYRYLPHINAKWLYMGMGDMFVETKHNIQEAGKQIMQKLSRIRLNEEDCNQELEKAEKEITYLKNQVVDKNEIINLLKNSNEISANAQTL